MNTKTCTQCKGVKLISEFGKRTTGKDELNSRCKQCQNLYTRLHRYNISEARYNSIVQNQTIEGQLVCAICFGPDPDCIDHCHETGEVRGILHKQCNSLVAMFNEDDQLLLKAFAYVRDFHIKWATGRIESFQQIKPTI